MIALLMTLMMGTAFAQDCDEWGTIAESDSIDSVYASDDPTELQITGTGDDCPDKDDCDWSLSDQTGTLGFLTDCAGNSPSGSPACFTPPATLENCQAQQVKVTMECPEVDGSGIVRDEMILTIRDISPDCSLDFSVSGGGCISPQSSAAWVLFPLFGLGGLARRRRS